MPAANELAVPNGQAPQANLPPGHERNDTHGGPAGGDLAATNDFATPMLGPSPQPSGGHSPHDTHGATAPENLPAAKPFSAPKSGAPQANLPPGHFRSDAHMNCAGGDDPLAVGANGSGQDGADTHHSLAAAENLGDQSSCDTHESGVPSANGHREVDTQRCHAVGDLSSALLMVYADSVDDLEKARIAAENRHRSLIQVKGLADSPEVERLGGLALALKGLEKDATLDLQRAVRRHPLGGWVKRTVGVGEKQGARLIAAIGDPLRYVDGETGEVVERTVSKLWAYCGYRPDQKRTKGQRSNWNATAKMRAFLVATSCVMKDGNGQPLSPFRKYYDAEREKWADRDTSNGHKHNHATRVVAKEILKAIYNEARRLELAEGHTSSDAHHSRALGNFPVNGHAGGDTPSHGAVDGEDVTA